MLPAHNSLEHFFQKLFFSGPEVYHPYGYLYCVQDHQMAEHNFSVIHTPMGSIIPTVTLWGFDNLAVTIFTLLSTGITLDVYSWLFGLHSTTISVSSCKRCHLMSTNALEAQRTSKPNKARWQWSTCWRAWVRALLTHGLCCSKWILLDSGGLQFIIDKSMYRFFLDVLQQQLNQCLLRQLFNGYSKLL